MTDLEELEMKLLYSKEICRVMKHIDELSTNIVGDDVKQMEEYITELQEKIKAMD